MKCLPTAPPFEEEALSSAFKHYWLELGSPVIRDSSPGQRQWVEVSHGECHAAAPELGYPR